MKNEISFDEKLANAEKIMASKEIKDNGKQLFEKVLKKATKKKTK